LSLANFSHAYTRQPVLDFDSWNYWST